MNPILQMTQIAPAIGQIKQIMQTAKDPMSALSRMNDPRIKEVMDMVNGKNPQEVFYQKCNEMGINPDVILGMLR